LYKEFVAEQRTAQELVEYLRYVPDTIELSESVGQCIVKATKEETEPMTRLQLLIDTLKLAFSKPRV